MSCKRLKELEMYQQYHKSNEMKVQSPSKEIFSAVISNIKNSLLLNYLAKLKL